MGRDVMDDRKRALVLGKFKFLYQEDAEELETLDRFQLACVQNKLLGPVQYTDKDGKSEEVLKIYEKEREAGEGYSNPPLDIPGVLDYFVVVWTNPFGEITVDQDIKLFEFEDIQKYSTYNEGPKAKEFCQFHSSSTSTELDGFDASIFWSTGLLWKHFKTCGVEKWDVELRELVTHYRNWQEWAHKVHNLPDQKKDKTGKFSNNKFSGPASTSGGYRRSKKRDASPLPRSCLVNDPTKKSKVSKSSSKISSSQDGAPSTSQQLNQPQPVLVSAPAPTQGIAPVVPGQPFSIPIAGTNGQTIQVQLVCAPQAGGVVPGASNLPLTPITPGDHQQSVYSYVNPAFGVQPNISVPPPNFNTWTKSVDDFLTRPKHDSSSSSKKNFERQLVPCLTSSPKKSGDVSTEGKDKGETTKKKVKKYKPKAKVEAPTFEDELKESKYTPSDKARMGIIKDWHGKFGFLRCDDIPGKIFLHSKDIKEGREFVGEGRRAFFQVLHYAKSVVGAKAVNVTVIKN
eukprot:TRINITY_DN63_c0_g1_i4.p1 TRINITY_DN63_c0_g1~~TRINITY_DN63_c0_g1_i4.p1  ORF type:complete len:513 (-),score=120.52 TRINITY_DN63_c0_g1_i4:467-2005(-)